LLLRGKTIDNFFNYLYNLSVLKQHKKHT
jgi:hypothetical protein